MCYKCFHPEDRDAGQALSALCLIVTPKELICPRRKMNEVLKKKSLWVASEHLGVSVCLFPAVCLRKLLSSYGPVSSLMS